MTKKPFVTKEKLEEKLKGVGADIERVKEDGEE